MKKVRIGVIAAMIAATLLSGCSNMSTTGKGAAIGAGGGAALGAIVGAMAGGGKGAAIGAAVGGGVGAGTGALIGRKMQKQREELERIEAAKVEEVTDANGLSAIKVTFDNGILFDTNKSTLSPSSKAALSKFAQSLRENPDTDVSIYGHTDNTGSLAVNERISLERAEAVRNYLLQQGIPMSRMYDIEGKAYYEPVGDNATAAGRAANRRVEIFISANQAMIDKANAGTLK